MALDMQLMLNLLERITKLIKLVSGKHFQKMRALRKAASDKSGKMTPTQILEAVEEAGAYFGLRMVHLFFKDVEKAFSIGVGPWLTKLADLEKWFDAVFLFVNRVILHSETQGLTVDQLWVQLQALPGQRRRRTSSCRSCGDGGAKLQQVAQIWAMLEQPRGVAAAVGEAQAARRHAPRAVLVAARPARGASRRARPRSASCSPASTARRSRSSTSSST